MNKRRYVLSSVIGVGLLLAGCGTGEEETKQVEAPTQEVEEVTEQAEVQAPTPADIANEGFTEEMERAPMVNEFNEEVKDPEEAFYSEYSSMKAFVEESVEDLKEGSEYRERHAHAEQFIANATITYIGYFHEEIEELGMTEDFEELKTDAAELIEKVGTGGEELEGYEQKYEEFENKLNDVLSKM